MRRRELALLGCRRMLPADLTSAIYLAAGSIGLTSLISPRSPLSRAPAAFEALAERRGLKMIVEPVAA